MPTRSSLIVLALVCAFSGVTASQQQHPVPGILHPNPLRFSYPRTVQTATISDIGKVELTSETVRVKIILWGDDHWFYVCSIDSERATRYLKRGDRVSIRPDGKFLIMKRLETTLKVRIIDVDRWGNL